MQENSTYTLHENNKKINETKNSEWNEPEESVKLEKNSFEIGLHCVWCANCR